MKQKEQKKKASDMNEKQKEDTYMNQKKTSISQCRNFWDNYYNIRKGLKNNIKATGAIYACMLKEILVTEEADELGHIHPSNAKVMIYVGCCNNHGFLHDKNLENNAGVNYDLIIGKRVVVLDPYQALENQREAKEDQPQDSTKQLNKDIQPDLIASNHLLIKDVLNYQLVFFLSEPRLGCYLASNISYQANMKYESLLSAIRATKEYLENKEEQIYKEGFDQKEELEKEREDIRKIIKKKEKEGRRMKEEQDKQRKMDKDNDLIRKELTNRNKDTIGKIDIKPASIKQGKKGKVSFFKQTTLQFPGITDSSVNSLITDLQNLQSMIIDWKEEPGQLKNYIKEEKKVYRAFDTIGKDRLLTDLELIYINDIPILIIHSIQALEKFQVRKNRDRSSAFTKREQSNCLIDIFTDEKTGALINPSANEYFYSKHFKLKNINHESLKAIEGDLAKAKFFSDFILQDSVYKSLSSFDQYEYVGDKKILQSLFYFVLTDPLTINEPETNKNQCKLPTMQKKDFFFNLKEFVSRGANPESVKSIYKLNRIKVNLDAGTKKTGEVWDYLFSLYQLVDYVLYLIKIRSDDITQRSANALGKKEKREKIILANTEILTETEREKSKNKQLIFLG